MSVCSPAAGQQAERVASSPPRTDDYAHLRPIPRGGLAVLAVLVTVLSMVIFMTFLLQNYQLDIIVTSAIVLACIVMAVGNAYAVCAITNDGMGLVTWLRGYWESNVLGIALWVHRCQDGQLHVKVRLRTNDRSSPVFNRSTGHYLPEWCSTCMGTTFVVLPLGGWFHRGSMDSLGGEQWRVWVPRWTSGELAHLPVQLRDGNGNRCSLILQHALELRHLRSRGFDALPLAFLLSHQALLGERRLLTEACATIEEAIERIQATSRFGKSKDAQAIRVWLQDQLARIQRNDSDSTSSTAATGPTATLEP